MSDNEVIDTHRNRNNLTRTEKKSVLRHILLLSFQGVRCAAVESDDVGQTGRFVDTELLKRKVTLLDLFLECSRHI